MNEKLWRRAKSLLTATAPRVRAWRRELHRIPEESFREYRTTEFLEKTLRELSATAGAELTLARPAATGLIAVLSSGPGPTVALRADIDALRQEEQTGCSFASLHPGLMHACGHDGHMAMLLGVVAVLLGLTGAWAGEVRFIFQHAEEVHPGGAREIAAGGWLDGLDFALATHLWSTLPVGTIGLRPGPFMAAPDNFILRLRGRGGHAAMPDKTADPVTTAAHVILALQTMLTREVDPLQSVVLSVTGLSGSDAFNVIPDEVSLKGTLRVLDEDWRQLLQEKTAATARGVCAAFGLECTAEFIPGYNVVDNDPALTEKMAAALARALPEVKIQRVEPLMCGEDFSVYQKYAPGLIFLTGAGNPAQGAVYPQHHARFQIDEDSLAIGTRALSAGALSLLDTAAGEADLRA
ncbi:MAG: amidohydrolase [Gracilibacteraceae bacterium]|nr:amidohydrolase [Gracilibacteraceae bacterium]